ncbi:MAG: TonB-dependent receptor [Saprospiraceae bacterium]|nr:TonB-dependent receptor [Saprospiraceae bacterium]
MRNLIVVSILLYLLSFDVDGKTILIDEPVVKGTVYSKDAQPVIGAHIVVFGSLITTATDLDGRFELFNLKPGNYELEISAIGYQKVSHRIQVRDTGFFDITIVFENEEVLIPEILIIGKSDRLLSKTPGSASYISSKELSLINPLSGNEALRRSPGIHVPDEEGVGMRANIGIRGLDPDRSRSLLILEDGIPVALAPYGEPEMYYTPPIDRMSGIEILKGSGQILYGPQTIGGVINYLTQSPPAEVAGKIRFQASGGGYLNTLFNYGNTINKTGFQITLLKKRADKVGLTAFDITDLNAKLVLNLSEKTSISIKTGFYDEISNSTYIGLTQTMYDQEGQDFVHMAPEDKLEVRRYSFSANHEYRFNSQAKLKTTAFAYTTTRNWRRQDFSSNGSSNSKPGNWTGVTWGDESVPDGAIYMRNSTGNRNRQFEVTGLETRLEVKHHLMGFDHELKTGIRYLYEIAHEQRVNGSKYNVSSGNLVEDEDRTGNAISLYLQNLTKLSDQVEIHLGLRFEQFDYEREISRRTFVIANENQIRDTILLKNNQIDQLIPGAGFTWKPLPNLSIYGGVHQGFAPPRTKDAISNTGEVYNLDAEKSVNYELGLRSAPFRGIEFELTAFYMDFSNQIIPVSESSGGLGSGLVNGGSTIHQGVEGGLKMNISDLTGWSQTSVLFDFNLTGVDAHFSGDRHKNEVPLSGNSTPYAPKILINSALSIQHMGGLGLRLTTNYVGQQYADELNTIEASPDGRNGLIPAYHTFDGNVFYMHNAWNTTFTLGVKNLTNERYIVNRRPQGIRVGLPRWVHFGVEYRF